MLKVKLVVLSVLFFVLILAYADYCEICLNHTLCQYPVSFNDVVYVALIADVLKLNSCVKSLDGVQME